MSLDEFEYNKDLLKEIVDQKGNILFEIEMEKKDKINSVFAKPKPTYEVF